MKVFGIRVLQGTYSLTKRRMENEMKILAVVATVWQFCDSRTYFRGGSDIRTKPMAFNMAGLFDSARRAKLAAMTVKRHYEAHRK
jgi:hypothetical protein